MKVSGKELAEPKTLLGFLNIHKPTGMTSHDVVQRVRKLLAVKQVGHGGTLDPLAQGVLPIAVGPACRLLRFLPNDKTYRAEILLGQQTTTDDLEGEIIKRADCPLPAYEEIRQSLSHFVGEIEQIPPAYSAVHHNGKRLYQLARSGALPEEIEPRQVTIHELEILKLELDTVEVRIRCGAGTYIRSIARDLGERLGVGGCLRSLVRERAGAFSLAEALNLDQLAELKEQGVISEALIDPLVALSSNPGLSSVEVDREVARRLSMGQRINGAEFDGAEFDAPVHGCNKILITFEKKLIAVCNLTKENLVEPEVVLFNAT